MLQLFDIRVPADNVEGTEFSLGRWLKKPGDAIKAHEPVVEVNSDKATLEISAPVTGVLLDIDVEPSFPVRPGQVLGRIKAIEGIATAAPTPLDESALPADGAEPAPSPPPPSPAPVDLAPAAQPASVARASDDGDDAGRLSPSVRKLLQQYNLKADDVPGSGRGGRITAEDVMRKVSALKQAATAPRKEAAPPRTKPPEVSTESDVGPSRRVAHTPMRRAIARHMVESALKTSPHVTSVFEVDFTRVLAHRARSVKGFEDRAVKLTLTSYLVRAAVKAIEAVPEVNGRWHEDSLEIFSDANIGIATALEKEGLVVPVIHGAQTLDLFGIATAIQRLTNRARGGQLAPEEIQGGTFTLTNHGVGGSLIATPIIHQPQIAILGVGKVQKRPVVIEARAKGKSKGADALEIRPMAYVTLTIDHRALDGFAANRFLAAFAEAIEKWS
jgi:2-oxoglutarate dehydrogenase E2 component (dihydrolipoamide succinyltransferase)